MYLEWRKYGDGSRGAILFGAPGRDLASRRRLKSASERVANDAETMKLSDALLAVSEEGSESLVDLAARVAVAVDTEDRDLPEEARELVQKLISEIELTKDDGAPAHEAHEVVDEALDAACGVRDEEALLRPGQVLLAELSSRVPSFLEFDADARELPGFQPYATAPPGGLANILRLAGVEFGDIAAATADRPRLQTLERRANANLVAAFGVWRQSEVEVVLDLSPDGIGLHVLDKVPDSLTTLDERSAGMRSFVALLAFIATRTDEPSPPVLMIDELEMHLHYSAQADLVEALHRQDAAQHVIYTTHSIGCLPEDLGASIRSCEPNPSGTSVIRHTPWTSGFGMAPLMAAMGAATFAFTPSRRAVVVEGLIDALLLPTLLREAQDGEEQAPLRFQVVPGLSEVPKRMTQELDADAGRIVYLADDDAGGRRHLRKVPAAAKQDGRALILGAEQMPGICVEDLVDAQKLCDALRAIGERHQKSIDVDPASVPAVARGAWIDELLEREGLEVSRTVLAYAILALEPPLLQADRTDLAQATLTALRAGLALTHH